MSAEFPQPELDPVNEEHFSSLKLGKLVVQKCKKCGAYQFYPRPVCVKCGSLELEYKETSGKGRIYSYTIIHRVLANSPAFSKNAPYIIASIEMEEGFRLYGRIKHATPEEVKIGQSVVFESLTLDNSLVVPAFKLTR
jgi:uncharacterized OB-fold protein